MLPHADLMSGKYDDDLRCRPRALLRELPFESLELFYKYRARARMRRAVCQWRLGQSRTLVGLARLIVEKAILPESRYARHYPADTSIDTFHFAPPHCDLLTKEEFRQLQVAIPQMRDPIARHLMNAHRPTLFFADRDIVEVVELAALERSPSPLLVGRTPDGQIVVRQDGIRGCYGATAAMLLSDLLARPAVPNRCNLASRKRVIRWLWTESSRPLIQSASSLSQLAELVAACGSAELGMDGHSIVVRAIHERGVEVCDSYHGWQIVVTARAFLDATGLGSRPIEVLQVCPVTRPTRSATCSF